MGYSIVRQEYTVEQRDYLTPCHISTRCKKPTGHAIVALGTTQFYAHRIAYERVHGPLPAGLIIHHLCEQPACVRPGHMVAMSRKHHLVVHSVHLSDPMKERLIHKAAERTHAYADLAAEFGVTEKGISRIMARAGYERHIARKVGAEMLAEMTRLRVSGQANRAIARQLGVSHSTVGRYLGRS